MLLFLILVLETLTLMMLKYFSPVKRRINMRLKNDSQLMISSVRIIRLNKITNKMNEMTQRHLRILKAISAVICSVIGGMLIVFGEIDDSPGLGGIGMVIIVIIMYLNVKLVDEK